MSVPGVGAAASRAPAPAESGGPAAPPRARPKPGRAGVPGPAFCEADPPALEISEVGKTCGVNGKFMKNSNRRLMYP